MRGSYYQCWAIWGENLLLTQCNRGTCASKQSCKEACHPHLPGLPCAIECGDTVGSFRGLLALGRGAGDDAGLAAALATPPLPPSSTSLSSTSTPGAWDSSAEGALALAAAAYRENARGSPAAVLAAFSSVCGQSHSARGQLSRSRKHNTVRGNAYTRAAWLLQQCTTVNSLSNTRWRYRSSPARASERWAPACLCVGPGRQLHTMTHMPAAPHLRPPPQR